MILDIHTHRPAPYPEGIVSLMDVQTPLMEGQFYSVGIHPWDTAEPITEETFVRLRCLAAAPRVAAIVECGVDLTRGGGHVSPVAGAQTADRDFGRG